MTQKIEFDRIVAPLPPATAAALPFELAAQLVEAFGDECPQRRVPTGPLRSHG